MDINPRLYVEIVPLEAPNAPTPHPVRQGNFDPAFVYKVLGMYNPSETSECYFVLANPNREIWFIPQRHLRAYKLINSDEFFLRKEAPESVLAPRAHRSESFAHPGADARSERVTPERFQAAK